MKHSVLLSKQDLVNAIVAYVRSKGYTPTGNVRIHKDIRVHGSLWLVGKITNDNLDCDIKGVEVELS